MSFFAELKRRNVVRVGIAYVIVGWLLAQVAEFAIEAFGAPDWALKLFVVFLILGLPLALLFAWAFELTPEGIKLEKHVERETSITHQTGRKLDFIIIAVMAVALIYMVADKFIGEPQIEEITKTTVPDDKSIAVLPFVNMSDDKDYFADGLSEELLNLLAKVPDLKVAGRTSSFAFKDKTGDFRAIGDALGVSTILEGSVRRSGDRLRITAQLINVADGYHIWSETYDRKMADIFEIQDDVAGAITSTLQLHLAPDADRPTDNLEAYSLYLEAMAVFRQVDDPLIAIEILDRALALDPSFAKAHERKAIYYWNTGSYTMDSPTAQRRVYESATAALAIDPSLIGAQTFLVTADPNDWTWSKEFHAIERARHEMPNDNTVLYSYCWDLSFVGYYREALDCANQLVALEPLWTWGHYVRGQILSFLDEREQAYIAWQRAADLGNAGGLIDRVVGHLARGEDDQAVEVMEKLYADFEFTIPGVDAGSIGQFIANARDPDTGKKYLRQLVATMVADADVFWAKQAPYIWYLGFGDLDAFYSYVIEMNDVESSWSNSQQIEYLARYIKASGYAADPRFVEQHKRWGMLDLWNERGPPDDCEKVDGNWVCE